MRNPDAILELEDDSERLKALAYLASKSRSYDPNLFIPPWQKQENEDRERPFVALHIHATYDDDARQHRIDTMEFYDGENRDVCYSTDPDEMVEWFLQWPLANRYASHLIVTDGGKAGILNAWLETMGRLLVARGYSIEPCMSKGGITWAVVRKGRRRWIITSAEVMTGLPLSSLLGFAEDATGSADGQVMPSLLLYTACDAYTTFLREHFGCALRPTVSMIASAAARRCMPENIRKWRPLPLLVAMEREGLGYRGGVTASHKHRGETYRIDVNRQYTAILESQLPLSSAFGRYAGPSSGEHGVFVCTVTAYEDCQYPVGVWLGEDEGFARRQIRKGTFVTVLHTSEFDALQALGCDIETGYGYAFTKTFTLADYVAKIRAVVETYGRTSPQGMATKPLGNMLYGKFGQQPKRPILMYSEQRPDDTWAPYWTPEEGDVQWVWEKTQERVTMGMHVEIAAHITGYARAQTITTMAVLEAMGAQPVRVHTDSITTVNDPRGIIPCDDETLGAWKFERHDEDSIIEHANAYADDDAAHVAGFSNVTREMLAEMHAGGEVIVAREVNLPRAAWYRRRGTIHYRLSG